MTWGIRITVLYLGFVSLILSLVFISTHSNSELESKDYYKQEIAYQDKIDAVSNANNLKTLIDYKVVDKSISISIPKEILNQKIKGEVYLLRPSDETKDLRFPITYSPDGNILIKDNKIEKGIYRMNISISSNGKNYILEEVIKFN